MILNFKDEILCETLSKVYSGLLPHDNFDSKQFSSLYHAVKSIIQLEDVRREYYVMYYILDKYVELSTLIGDPNFSVELTQERFENSLSNNIPDLILNINVEITQLLEEEGKSSDLSIPTIRDDAMQLLYSRTLYLYEVCYDLMLNYQDSLASLADLRSVVQANMIETGINYQRNILSNGARYNGKTYIGAQGWIDFVQHLMKEVSEAQSIGDEDLICDSVNIVSKIDSQVQESSEPLGYYGIPIIDERTPMLKHRLAVLVARENTGKTNIVKKLIASLIVRGVKCFFACGEASKEDVQMSIVSSYIRQAYNMYFPVETLVGEGFERLSEEDKQLVATAKAKVATSGLVISTDLEYDNITSKFTHYYVRGCRAFFIDHTQSLLGRKGRPISELVSTLAMDCRDFKRKYPAYVMVTSHPSANLKELLQKSNTKDTQISPTAQSSLLSAEADELFILTENEHLSRQGLLQLITYKSRKGARPGAVYIRKEFDVAHYVYDEKDQSGENIDAAELNNMLSHVGEEIYVDPYDADDLEFELSE